MKIFVGITATALSLLMLASCCACRKGANNLPVEGTVWQVVRMMGRDYSFEKGEFTFTFDAGRLSGRGACNQINGGYRTTPTGGFSVEGLASTRMMCPEQSLETEFAALLERTTHIEVDGNMLLLLSNGELQAVLQAVE